MLVACWRRNTAQLTPSRRGAGPSPWRLRSVRIAVAETRRPSFPIPLESADIPTADSRQPTGESTPASPRRGPVGPAARGHYRTTSIGRARGASGARSEALPGRRAAGLPRQATTRRGEEQPVTPPKPRAADLSAEHLKLVAQDHDLQVFGVLVIPHERGEDSPEEQGHEDRTMEVLPLVRGRPTGRLYRSERRPWIIVPFRRRWDLRRPRSN